LEREWLDELCRLVGLEKTQLPVIWGADFLCGPKDADGANTFVLCEVNVSSVYPFPKDALLVVPAPRSVTFRSGNSARRLANHFTTTVAACARINVL
jgi:hypothetical protein